MDVACSCAEIFGLTSTYSSVQGQGNLEKIVALQYQGLKDLLTSSFKEVFSLT